MIATRLVCAFCVRGVVVTFVDGGQRVTLDCWVCRGSGTALLGTQLRCAVQGLSGDEPRVGFRFLTCLICNDVPEGWRTEHWRRVVDAVREHTDAPV